MTSWMMKALALLLVALGFVRERQQKRIDAWKARLRRRLRWMFLGVVTFALVAAVTGGLTVVLGVAPIKASSGHWAITAWFLEFSMERSVATHSMGLEPPSLNDPRLVLMGAGHYETGCRFCHGIPGEPMPRVPHHMTPHPTRLSEEIGTYDDAGLFYITKHGVKFTGMPAWPSRQRDDEVWAMVAFMRRLPELDAEGYRRLVFGDAPAKTPEAPEVVLDVCARCHGVDGLGRGEGAFPKLAGQRPEYLRRSLLAYQRGDRHSGIMEPIAGRLTRTQLSDAVRWYAGRAPPATSGTTGSSRGEAIATRGIPERRVPACANCHGPGQRPRYPVYPRLAGQYAAYLEQQLRLFYEGKRGGTEYVDIMQTVAEHKLEPEDISEVAKFYSALTVTEPSDESGD